MADILNSYYPILLATMPLIGGIRSLFSVSVVFGGLLIFFVLKENLLRNPVLCLFAENELSLPPFSILWRFDGLRF